ncbi:MAG TPA: GNAT family protein [Actinomycetota bacterium]
MSPLPIDLGDGAELRRYVLDDLDALWAAVDENRERLGEWMPWVEHTNSIEDQRVWLERVVAAEEDLDGTGLFVDGDLAGGIGLSFGPFGIAAEVGYWVRAAYEGRGLIGRGAEAMVDLAFREHGVHRVVIRAGIGNVRSRAIPERLGFTLEGVARGEGKGLGGFYDLAVYGILEDEWRAR